MAGKRATGGECLKCGSLISFGNRSTTAMKDHLSSHARQERLSSGRSRVRGKGYGCIHKIRHWLIGVLVAVLSIPYRAFDHPAFKILFRLAGFGTVNRDVARRTCEDEYSRVRDIVAADLSKLKEQDVVFVLVADEWSWMRKRFIGVTLCSSLRIPSLDAKQVDIMVRFRDHGTAKNILEGLRAALEVFGLTFSDIRGITTDAASTMLKVGQLIKEEIKTDVFYQQKCLAHGLHLAVIEALNQKSQAVRVGTEASTQFLGFGIERDNEDEDLDAEGPSGPTVIEQVIEISDSPHWVVIKKIRAISNEFNQSGKKSDDFELICRRISGLRVSKFSRDVQIRWNSTLEMLERFMILEEPLRTYYDRIGEDFPLSEEEMTSLRCIIPALRDVEEASARLSGENATLNEADVILEVGSAHNSSETRSDSG